MLYHLLFPLAKYSIVFNVFRYVTFRSIGAFITSLILSLLVGPAFIRAQTLAAVETIDQTFPKSIASKLEPPPWVA